MPIHIGTRRPPVAYVLHVNEPNDQVHVDVAVNVQVNVNVNVNVSHLSPHDAKPLPRPRRRL
jgi:hypothetical protein